MAGTLSAGRLLSLYLPCTFPVLTMAGTLSAGRLLARRARPARRPRPRQRGGRARARGRFPARARPPSARRRRRRRRRRRAPQPRGRRRLAQPGRGHQGQAALRLRVEKRGRVVTDVVTDVVTEAALRLRVEKRGRVVRSSRHAAGDAGLAAAAAARASAGCLRVGIPRRLRREPGAAAGPRGLGVAPAQDGGADGGARLVAPKEVPMKGRGLGTELPGSYTAWSSATRPDRAWPSA